MVVKNHDFIVKNKKSDF